ncbi:hypothetical protein DVW12_17080 [Clostridium botulinum]|nr:hypothetical protein [Clostridium botulinum]
MSKIKVISTLEHNFDIDWETHTFVLLNSTILQSNIFDENENSIGEKNIYQFTKTEKRYGIISLGKKHPLASLYKSGEIINVSIDEKTVSAKWHSVQVRIDGLTKLFSSINLEDAFFEVKYLIETNTLHFTRI